MGNSHNQTQKNRSLALQNKAKYALNEARPEGATNAREPLTDNTNAGGSRMADTANISPRGDSTNQIRQTPGSTPWKAAVIRDLREGYGVEDIALRMDCRVEAVRELVAELRKAGLLPRMYHDARKKWREERA